jgi:hypothetical protein
MRHSITIALLLWGTSTAICLGDKTAHWAADVLYGSPTAPRLVADLADGSRIIGTPGFATLPFETDAGLTNIPLTHLGVVDLPEHDRRAHVRLRNGQTLNGIIKLVRLALTTRRGGEGCDISNIVRIQHEESAVASLLNLYVDERLRAIECMQAILTRMPPTVSITAYEHSQRRLLTLSGAATRLSDVAMFRKVIEGSALFQAVDVLATKQDARAGSVLFDLHILMMPRGQPDMDARRVDALASFRRKLPVYKDTAPKRAIRVAEAVAVESGLRLVSLKARRETQLADVFELPVDCEFEGSILTSSSIQGSSVFSGSQAWPKTGTHNEAQ